MGQLHYGRNLPILSKNVKAFFHLDIVKQDSFLYTKKSHSLVRNGRK